MMKYKIHFLFVMFFVLSFGCIDNFNRTGSSSMDYGYGYDYDSYPSAPKYDESISFETGIEMDNKIIKSGSITVEVPQNSIEEKYDDLISKLKIRNVEIVDLQYHEYTYEKRYSITVKVLPNQFESIINEVKTFGNVKSTNINVEDVTERYVDVERRIAHKEVQLNRLYELYNQTGTVVELLELEREISRIEYELESLKATKISYDKRVDKSTIVIYLTEKKFESESSIFDTFNGLIPLFLKSLSYGLMFIVGVLGFIIPLSIILLIIKFLFFRKK